MPSPINKKLLKHLAELARIELSPREETRLLADLQGILAYFDELNALDTTGIAPQVGGAFAEDVLRGDAERTNTHRGAGVKNFPKEEKGFLATPPVFNE